MEPLGRAETFELTRTRRCTPFDRDGERADALGGPPTIDAGRDDDAGEYTFVAVTFATIYNKSRRTLLAHMNLDIFSNYLALLGLFHPPTVGKSVQVTSWLLPLQSQSSGSTTYHSAIPEYHLDAYYYPFLLNERSTCPTRRLKTPFGTQLPPWRPLSVMLE